ncbi:MAG: hypothetical protein NTX50_06140 [Candidatus Sumerlaeota bacterium]|nr:hypothetical protein [Candidatus Sumerlaeota bacterium]
MGAFKEFLKTVGATPLSQEYRIGDTVVSKNNGRTAVVVAVVPQTQNFKVKVAYKDRDEIGYLDPEDIQHAA